MAKKTKPLTAGEIADRLRARYAPPEWVLLEEVQPTMGFMGKPRRADVVALSTYPSKGLQLFGFELKSSRADVLKELKQPDKALAWQRYCDRWYLVLGRADLIKVDELPPNWGLIVPRGDGLRTVEAAPRLTPEDWPRGLTCMLVRKAYGNTIADHVKGEIEKAAYARAKESFSCQLGMLKDLEEKVLEFENLSGISIRYARKERVMDQGKLLKVVMRQGLEGYRRQAERLAVQAERLGKELREALERNEAKA